MKTTQFKRLTTMLLLVTAMAMPKMAWAEITPTQPSIGDGTSANPYQIGTAEELYWFAALVNGTLTDGTAQNLSANAILVNDITVNTGVLNADGTLASNTSSFRVWTPIGTSSNLYKGTFDGQGHEVIGLYFNDTSAENVGMFGCSDGTIKNVGGVDSYFSGNMRVGGVCGYNYKGISNCYNRSTVNGVSNVGGIVGVNWGSACTIRNCYNTGSISASNYGAGGIAGYNYYATITDCYSSAAISAPKTVGGICGATDGKSTIKNCYHNSRYYTGNAIGTTSSSGTEENVSAKTEAQFASGEVCYLLNGSTSDGAWGQTLSGTNKQDYPVFGGDKVYYGYADCDESKDKTYSNTELADTRPGHNFNEHGFCTVCGAYQPALDSDGDGYLEIGNAGQLYWFADKVNNDNANYGSANAVLTADITVNKDLLSLLEYDTNGNVTNSGDFKNWTPIANSGDVTYKGTFDGQNHTVSGLYFNDPSIGYVGLFGCLAKNGAIKNTGVIDSYFCGEHRIGGVCGEISGTITNCYSTGEVTATSTAAYVGGVCGSNFYGTITNCYNTGTVSGSQYVGGVCGSNFYGAIANCYNLNTTASDSNAVSKTAEQFASGEVAYLLSQGCTENVFAGYDENDDEIYVSEFFDGLDWGQTIGTDNYPVLGGDKVYYGYVNCDESKDKTYSNTKLADTRPGHNFNEHGFCTVCGAYQPATDSDSDGVYEIGNAGQLYWFAALVNGTDGLTQNKGANAILTNNITINNNVLVGDELNSANESSFRKWTPIGNSYTFAYTGTFDGNNNTISGVYYSENTEEIVLFAGLFGKSDGSISNIIIKDSYFSLTSTSSTNLANCFSALVGANGGTIKNCQNYSVVEFNGKSCYLGGLCGDNAGNGFISECTNYGKITAVCSDKSYIGGVAGANFNKIENCNNAGSVTDSYNSTSSRNYVGGICGENYNAGTIENCYSSGSVSGNSYVPGVCEKSGIITNCYYLWDSDDSLGGKTSEQFKSGEVCYLLNNGKTDGSQVWYQTLDSDSYPLLDNSHGTVYACTPCTGVFSNTEGQTAEHSYTQIGATADAHGLHDILCAKCSHLSETTRGVKDFNRTGEFLALTTHPEGTYSADEVTLYDTDEAHLYNCPVAVNVGTLHYTRTFAHDRFEPLYVPFAMSSTDWGNAFEVYAVSNVQEYTPSNGATQVQLEVRKVTSGTLRPNTPYLIRAAAGEQTITMSNVALQAAADNTIGCSSMTYSYKLNGSYTTKTAFNDQTDYLLEAGLWVRPTDELAPQRWYLSVQMLGSLVEGLPDDMVEMVGITEQGSGPVTDLDNLRVVVRDAASSIAGLYTESGRIVCDGEFRIYDLLGRDVTHLNGSLCGVYVVKTADTAQKVVVK